MLQCMLGFWGYFSAFWYHFLMISGSNLGGLPPPEHFWDLLAAAGGSPMLQSMIFDGFWLPSWVLWGPLSVMIWKKGSSFWKQFCRSLLERLQGSFWSPKSEARRTQDGSQNPSKIILWSIGEPPAAANRSQKYSGGGKPPKLEPEIIKK